MEYIPKLVGESFSCQQSFQNTDPSIIYTIVGVVVSAVVLNSGADATSQVIDSSGTTYNGNQAIFRVTGGVAGTSYLITLTATMNDTPATVRQEQFVLEVN